MGRKNLYIVGAGGFGRECAGNFRLWGGFADRYDLKGFLDDNPAALAGYADYPPIRGRVGDFRPGPDDVFVCALGLVAVRRRCLAALAAKGGRFATLVAPSAVVHATARLGEGCLVLDHTIVSADVTLGDHVLCHANVLLGHDTRVGDHAVIESYAFTGGFAEIGCGATLHTRATVLPGKRVGEGAVVGAGSVVLASVPAGKTVFGVPAVDIAL